MKNLKDFGLLTNPMQIMRIAGSGAFKTGEGLIVDDNLEMGYIRIFENDGKPVTIQKLADIRRNREVTMVAEMIVNEVYCRDEVEPFGCGCIINDEKLWIHSVNFEKGYEFLAKDMIAAVEHFAEFYGYETIELDKKILTILQEAAPGVLAEVCQCEETGIYEAKIEESEPEDEE
jgi:hypothetical protein